MKNKEIKIRFIMPAIGFMLMVGWFQFTDPRIAMVTYRTMQSYLVDYGAECELSPLSQILFAWPAQVW